MRLCNWGRARRCRISSDDVGVTVPTVPVTSPFRGGAIEDGGRGGGGNGRGTEADCGGDRWRPLIVAFDVQHPNLSLVLKLEELTGMATKLYVGNLSPNTTESQILDLFKQSGNVVSCQLIKDKVTGVSKGFAFVEMGSEAEAAKAMADCNGKELDGRALKVNEAKPRAERPMKK